MASARKVIRFPPMPKISDLVRLYGLRARKQLSQNFIFDMNVTDKIAKCADVYDCHVVEVGSGPGSLTRSLLKRGVEHLYAVDVDKRFVPSLEMIQEVAKDFMSIHIRDIMRLDMTSIIKDPITAEWDSDILPNVRLVGNLPFNVSIPLTLQWLEAISSQKGPWKFGRVPMTLVYQAEVGENLLAEVDSFDRNRMALMTQNYCHVTRPMILNRTVFTPEPEVDAWLMHFVPRRQPLIDAPFLVVEQMVRGIFTMKRKQVKHGMTSLFPNHANKSELACDLLDRAGVPHTKRPHHLEFEEVDALTQAFMKMCEEDESISLFPFKLRKPPRICDVDMDWCTQRITDEDEET